jgi:hypothetical protein
VNDRGRLAAVITFSVVVLAACTSGPASAPGASPSGSPAASAAAPDALGPSACDTSSQTSSQSASWKLVAPATLCGLPVNNSAAQQSSSQAMVSAVEGDLQNLNGPAYGQQTSSVSQGYQVARNSAGVYRSITFTGLDGTFSPQAAANAVETSIEDNYTFSSVPPGPHGGVMACGSQFSDTETCVWATPTTLGLFTIIDTTKELVGSSIAANAVSIRDVLEVAS